MTILAHLAALTPAALALRGDIQERLGQFNAAVTDIEAALQADPDNSALWARLSGLLARQMQSDAALAALNRRWRFLVMIRTCACDWWPI